MKTTILLPVWKRPQITKLCFENITRAILPILAGVSEDWAEEMCQKYYIQYVRIENEPLGRKKNKLLERALNYKWDQIMELGSDDLLDLSKLDDHLSIENDHYGVNCSYMIHPETGRAKFHKIGGLKRIWGAGRVISREAVEKSIPLWDDKGTKYLDAQANNALQKAGYPFSVVQEPMFVQVKTETNIHDYDRFPGKPVPMNFLKKKFPELESLIKV